MLAIVWSKDVTPQTIANCWRHSGLFNVEREAEDYEDPETEGAIRELMDYSRRLRVENSMDISYRLNHPDEQQVAADEPERKEDDSAMPSPTDEDDSEQLPCVTAATAAPCLDGLRTFFLRRAGDNKEQLNWINKLDDLVSLDLSQSRKQSTLECFFHVFSHLPSFFPNQRIKSSLYHLLRSSTMWDCKLIFHLLFNIKFIILFS